MSDDNDNGAGEGIADLRKQYETLKKELASAKEVLGSYQGKERAATVAGVLKAKGLPEGIADEYTADDLSEDTISKWAEAKAAKWGFTPTGQVQELDENSSAAERAAAVSHGNVASIQANPGGPVGDVEKMLHAIQTLPREELQKLGYLPKDEGLYGSVR